tara:strand:+ start:207 stop:809 length:603 start_codon:yes stop_codon:yes gene_type:complete
MIEKYIFLLFSMLVIGSALLVVTVRNPVHSALFLILSFFSCAGLWLLLEAEFLAIALVLVYVGAVMVLFMFVVMMIDIDIKQMREGFRKYLILAFLFSAPLIFGIIGVVSSDLLTDSMYLESIRHDDNFSNTYQIGYLLFTEYVLPFEIAALILLVAIVAAITLTLRKTRQRKAPNIDEQVSVKREDRIRLVDIPREDES